MMFPEFDWRWAYEWIITVEQHCEAKGVSEEKKFSEAEKALTRDAFFWWYSWKKRNERAKLWDFVIALLREFEPESKLYLPDPVEDSGKEEIPGEEGIQKEEARNIKASNLEIRRNRCEEWISSSCFGGEQHEGDEVSEHRRSEVAPTEIDITTSVKTAEYFVLAGSRSEPAVATDLEVKKRDQMPPEKLYRGLGTAARTTPPIATVETYYVPTAERRGHAAGVSQRRGARRQQPHKRPPPRPPELLDRGDNPAAYATTPAPATSATQATQTKVTTVAKDMKEIFQQGGAKLELQQISQLLPLSQHLRPPFDLMGLAQHDSSYFATGNLLLKLLIAFGKTERKLQNLGLLFKPIDCGPITGNRNKPSQKVYQICGVLRTCVIVHLWLNPKMFMDAKHGSIVQISFFEASNLQVLKDSSLIHSNANLGVRGQSFLNLSELGNLIEAQHLILSLLTNSKVGTGPVLRGPLEVSGEDNMMVAQLYWEIENGMVELPHPPEKCNMNSSWILTLQICRVEVASVEGATTGSGMRFYWIRRLSVEVILDVDVPTIIQLQVQSIIPFCSILKALTPYEMIKQGGQAVLFYNTDGNWCVNWQKDSKSFLLDSWVIYMILRVVKADVENTNKILLEKHMDPSYVICSMEYRRLTQEIQKLIEGEGDIVKVRVRMRNMDVCISSTLDVKKANEETEQQLVISSHMFISRRVRTLDLAAQAVCYAYTQVEFAEEIFSKSWTHMIAAKTLWLGLLLAIECKMDTWDPGGCSYFSATTWSTSCFKPWDPGGVFLSQPLPSCLNEEGELQPELEHLLASRSGQQEDREVPMKWKTLPDFDNSWESLAAMKECFQPPSLRTRMFFRKGEMIGTQKLVVLVLRYLLGRVGGGIKLIPTSDNCQADVAVSSGC